MKRILFKKVLSSLVVIFLLTVLIFLIIRLLPGDPITIMLGEHSTPEAREALTQRFNFDKPLPVQYALWFKDIIRGEWGTSLTGSGEVMPQILERFPRSLMLCLMAIVVSLMIAIPLGVITAAKQNTAADFTITTATLLVLSIPEFWLGMLLLLLCAVSWGILPAERFCSDEYGFCRVH